MGDLIFGELGGMFAAGFAAGAAAGYGFAMRIHTKALIDAATAPLVAKVEHLEEDVRRLNEENVSLHTTIDTLFARIVGSNRDGKVPSSN